MKILITNPLIEILCAYFLIFIIILIIGLINSNTWHDRGLVFLIALLWPYVLISSIIVIFKC